MKACLTTPRLASGGCPADKLAISPKEVIARLMAGTTIQIVDGVLLARQV